MIEPLPRTNMFVYSLDPIRIRCVEKRTIFPDRHLSIPVRFNALILGQTFDNPAFVYSLVRSLDRQLYDHVELNYVKLDY